MTWQDPETGGFYATRADRSEDAEQELFPTAQAGMSFALTGRVEAAIRAGEWFQRLWDLQPEPERRLYAVYSRSQGLVQNYPEDQEAFYVTKKDEPWQHHFNGGIAAAFLSQLHMATGDTQWLDLAREYQRFSMTSDECQFDSKQLCKSGWGSGLLYVATREEQFREWTMRLGDTSWKTATGRTPSSGHPNPHRATTSWSLPSLYNTCAISEPISQWSEFV